MTCNNTLRDRLYNLFRKAFIPLHVSDNPLIKTGCIMQYQKDFPIVQNIGETNTTPNKLNTTTEDSGERCDLLVWYLCQKGTGSIHKMRFVNTDTSSYL